MYASASQSLSLTWRGSRRVTNWSGAVIEIRGQEHNQARRDKGGYTLQIDWHLSPPRLTLGIHLLRTEKQERQFSLLLCFHHCYFLWQVIFFPPTALQISDHTTSLIDLVSSSTNNKRNDFFPECSISIKLKSKFCLSPLSGVIFGVH